MTMPINNVDNDEHYEERIEVDTLRSWFGQSEPEDDYEQEDQSFLANKESDDEVLVKFPFEATEAALEGALMNLSELSWRYPKPTNEPNTQTPIEILVSDYRRLNDRNHLNDSLLNLWMHWISRYSSDVYFFPTWFYTYLNNDGVEKVKSWVDVNIFDKKLLFFPTNIDNLHWNLSVVVNPGAINDDANSTYLLIFDSLGCEEDYKNGVRENLVNWLNDRWNDETGPFSEVKIYEAKVDLQTNSFDCGVCVCRYALGMLQLKHSTELEAVQLRIASEQIFDFDVAEMQRFRRELKTFIRRLHLLYEQRDCALANKKSKESNRQHVQNEAAKNVESDESKEAAGTAQGLAPTVSTESEETKEAAGTAQGLIPIVNAESEETKEAAGTAQGLAPTNNTESEETKEAAGTVQGLAPTDNTGSEETKEAAQVAQGLAPTDNTESEETKEAAQVAQGLAPTDNTESEETKEAAQIAQGLAPTDNTEEDEEPFIGKTIEDSHVSNPFFSKQTYATAVQARVDSIGQLQADELFSFHKLDEDAVLLHDEQPFSPILSRWDWTPVVHPITKHFITMKDPETMFRFYDNRMFREYKYEHIDRSIEIHDVDQKISFNPRLTGPYRRSVFFDDKVRLIANEKKGHPDPQIEEEEKDVRPDPPTWNDYNAELEVFTRDRPPYIIRADEKECRSPYVVRTGRTDKREWRSPCRRTGRAEEQDEQENLPSGLAPRDIQTSFCDSSKEMVLYYQNLLGVGKKEREADCGSHGSGTAIGSPYHALMSKTRKMNRQFSRAWNQKIWPWELAQSRVVAQSPGKQSAPRVRILRRAEKKIPIDEKALADLDERKPNSISSEADLVIHDERKPNSIQETSKANSIQEACKPKSIMFSSHDFHSFARTSRKSRAKKTKFHNRTVMYLVENLTNKGEANTVNFLPRKKELHWKSLIGNTKEAKSILAEIDDAVERNHHKIIKRIKKDTCKNCFVNPSYSQIVLQACAPDTSDDETDMDACSKKGGSLVGSKRKQPLAATASSMVSTKKARNTAAAMTSAEKNEETGHSATNITAAEASSKKSKETQHAVTNTTAAKARHAATNTTAAKARHAATNTTATEASSKSNKETRHAATNTKPPPTDEYAREAAVILFSVKSEPNDKINNSKEDNKSSKETISLANSKTEGEQNHEQAKEQPEKNLPKERSKKDTKSKAATKKGRKSTTANKVTLLELGVTADDNFP